MAGRPAHSRRVVRGGGTPVRGTGVDQRNLGAIGVFRVDIEPSQPAPRALERGLSQ